MKLIFTNMKSIIESLVKLSQWYKIFESFLLKKINITMSLVSLFTLSKCRRIHNKFKDKRNFYYNTMFK